MHGAAGYIQTSLIRSIKVMTCCLIINVINAQPANVTPNQRPSADETGVSYRVTERGIFNVVSKHANFILKTNHFYLHILTIISLKKQFLTYRVKRNDYYSSCQLIFPLPAVEMIQCKSCVY